MSEVWFEEELHTTDRPIRWRAKMLCTWHEGTTCTDCGNAFDPGQTFDECKSFPTKEECEADATDAQFSACDGAQVCLFLGAQPE